MLLGVMAAALSTTVALLPLPPFLLPRSVIAYVVIALPLSYVFCIQQGMGLPGESEGCSSTYGPYAGGIVYRIAALMYMHHCVASHPVLGIWIGFTIGVAASFGFLLIVLGCINWEREADKAHARAMQVTPLEEGEEEEADAVGGAAAAGAAAAAPFDRVGGGGRASGGTAAAAATARTHSTSSRPGTPAAASPILTPQSSRAMASADAAAAVERRVRTPSRGTPRMVPTSRGSPAHRQLAPYRDVDNGAGDGGGGGGAAARSTAACVGDGDVELAPLDGGRATGVGH